MGSRHEVARTVLAQAALLEEAREAFQAFGMPALVARAEQLAGDWAAPPGGDEGARLSTVA